MLHLHKAFYKSTVMNLYSQTMRSFCFIFLFFTILMPKY